MNRRNVWSIWGGVVLIGLGVIFLVGQFLPGRVMGFLWPLFILAGGALFFTGMVAGGKSTGALAIPGSILTMLALIFLVQAVFDIWATWAYAWTLLIVAVGIGLIIFGMWSAIDTLPGVGRLLIIIGLGLFFVFGFFFEVLIGISGRGSFAGIIWPIMLILLGIVLVFGRSLFGSSGPLQRFVVDMPGLGVFAAPSFEYGASDAPAIAGTPDLTGLTPGAITRLVHRSIGDMTIIQGEEEGLVIEANEQIKSRIRTELRGGVLNIWFQNDWLDWLGFGMWNNTRVRYELKVRNLESIKLAGLGKIHAARLLAPRLEISQTGAGDVTIDGLETTDLHVSLTGAGNVVARGRADHQEVVLSGMGNYDGAHLNSRSANVRVTGLGNATVRVEERLDAHLSGLGNIEYYGAPQVNHRASGLGNIKSLGS